jgi:hypothetical protein
MTAVVGARHAGQMNAPRHYATIVVAVPPHFQHVYH